MRAGLRSGGSLRLRLMLWYGALVLATLIVFGVLLLVLSTNALTGNTEDAVRAEARVATLDLSRELRATPPYWPGQLTLTTVDAYHAPGVIIEVLDARGNIHYRSAGAGGATVPLSAANQRAALSGQTTWYSPRIGGQPVRVEALPIRAPTSATPPPATPTSGTPTSGQPAGPIIGVLLVAKSLNDVNATLLLLKSLLIGTGFVSLALALLGAWFIGARVLRPVAAIGETARAIAQATARGIRPSALSRRARHPGGQDELAKVVDLFNEMLAALEDATQTQRRFIADASHELRAPLTTMQGNLAFLRQHLEELPAEERRTMLVDAHAETLRLARLVDELLLLARADAGGEARGADAAATEPQASGQASVTEPQASGQASVTELDRAIPQLVRQLRGRLRAEGNPVRLELGRIEPARVRGEEETLRRIALILLDNAIKYTPAETDGHPGAITVSLECAGNEALLRVRDTGIGIDIADLPHIFERFYRADRARGRQGTGLGLAIARTLVEQLGGRISAESAPGQGTTFTVALPLM